MSKIEIPPLPEPFDYCYEWDGPYGSRKFSVAPHNGRQPDRSVPIYRASQLHARDRQIVELCESICVLQARKSQAVDGSAFYIATGQCAAAIHSLLNEKEGNE